ncbi:MAG: MAPEG family protein [Tabrizicola sp.]
MAFQTTALYALPLALLGLVLWFRVTSVRAALKVSIGDAGNPGLHERIRQHGNFIEWAPMVLVLMMLAEGNGAGALWLHAAGGLLLVGRLVHPFGLKADNAGHPLRYVGNSASLLAMIIVMVSLAVAVFRL